MTIPKSLETPGRALWRKLESEYIVTGIEPLLEQLCTVHDRLHQLRAELKKRGITEGQKLLADEARMLGQYRQLWKAAGFADEPKQQKRGGRQPYIHGRVA